MRMFVTGVHAVRMTSAGHLMVILGIVFCTVVQCYAAPAAEASDAVTSSLITRRHMCGVVHFRPPNQHIYCCHLVDDCECPHRMGVCAPTALAALDVPPSSPESLSSWVILKRIFNS